MYIYILSILVSFGLSGNCISLIIFKIQRRRKGPTTLVLLICLVVADSLYLTTNIFSRMLPTFSTYLYLGEKLKWFLYICTMVFHCLGCHLSSILCFHGFLQWLCTDICNNSEATKGQYLVVQKEDGCFSSRNTTILNCLQRSKIFWTSCSFTMQRMHWWHWCVLTNSNKDGFGRKRLLSSNLQHNYKKHIYKDDTYYWRNNSDQETC